MAEMNYATPSAMRVGAEQRGLNEFERITKVFYAPSETFADLKRSANWLVPFLLMVVVSFFFVTSVAKKVGWDQVVENTYKVMPPSQLEKIQAAPPDAQEKQRIGMLYSFRYGSYAFPVLMLIFYAIAAAIYLAVMNFGVGAQLRYKELLALLFYAGLPVLIGSIIAIVGIWTFIDPQEFQMRTPIASNPATFMNATAHPFLYSFSANFDLFALWSTILIGIGLAVLAKKSLTTGLAVSFGLLILRSLVFALPSLL
jgi:hypothetical protein